MKFEKVLVTGGAGYVGSLLVPQLLDAGYKVTVYDIMYFGDDFLPKNNPNLTLIKGDIRDTPQLTQALKNMNAVISLACISNDASFELDEKLSTSVNLHAFEPMVLAAKAAGVKRFIYCSSSSVYGVSDSPNVTEEHPLVPLTLYNKYKGMCEPLLFKHQSPEFTCVAIRPATLCGYAPRQRLDLSVNILTNHAMNNNKITVFGGEQKRPNLHIQDMVDLYKLLLRVPDEKIAGQIFNAAIQNMSIMEIAQTVKHVVEDLFPEKGNIPIEVTSSDDLRSYHVNSDKIRGALDFQPKRTVEDAVRDLCVAFKAGKLQNSLSDTFYYNVKRLKELRAS
ncbi:MAG: UDP-glucose 4-epimerase [Deltaproteobacteria bacterium CG_4_10_14_0_2_um_filter_43_8]|nr:MAG: UDP-glucose 4-epimerase [Deltaproteobacteria bacterium CG11_big_fil_rev_8_21_14_0_20_42_23]PJA21720.1 MAG: UDP-glucose 4-epimerase [Deltaproteobacteria bacterium CG_4_10_14_0_2_um_filter_43_8]PJC64573.1 MAG: UDP-glucose 4-epimerase [Deltaproteobacteria bacterium CG_4_9_14_0_2_um_filter_42_21]